MNLLIECVLAIDEEDAQAFPSEEPSALKARETSADDSHIITAHKRLKALCFTKSRQEVTPKGSLRQDFYWPNKSQPRIAAMSINHAELTRKPNRMMALTKAMMIVVTSINAARPS